MTTVPRRRNDNSLTRFAKLVQAVSLSPLPLGVLRA